MKKGVFFAVCLALINQDVNIKSFCFKIKVNINETSGCLSKVLSYKLLQKGKGYVKFLGRKSQN